MRLFWQNNTTIQEEDGERVRAVQSPNTWEGVYKFAKKIEDLSKQLKSKK